MRKLSMAMLLAVLVGCGKGDNSQMGKDGKCTVEGFRPFGTSQSALSSSQRALALKTLNTKAEAYNMVIFLIASPKRPTVMPGDNIMAAVAAGLASGTCKAVETPIIPPKGATTTERSVLGESCPINFYLKQDELKGEIFEGYSSAKQHRLTKFNDLSLSKNDLISMKYDGEVGGDVESGDVKHSSICESFQGELETKSLGMIPFYSSQEARHAFRTDYDASKPETFAQDNESHTKLRRGFKFADFTAEFEVEHHRKALQDAKMTVTLNGEPLSAEELSVLGTNVSARFGVLSSD